MAESHYATVDKLLGPKPKWIADEEEQKRVAAYTWYEDAYWGVPDTFRVAQRGQDNTSPIYIPSGRSIVETINRFVGPQMNVVPDPLFGTRNDQLLAQQFMTDLMRREKLVSRFNSNKRFGFIRGDWMFHIIGNPNGLPGSKLSVMPLDPSFVFPIYLEGDIDTVIGWDIAEPVIEGSKNYIRRTTYMKKTLLGGPSPIVVTDELYEFDEWGGPGMVREDAKVFRAINPPQELPAPIDQLPIYHFKNGEEPGRFWGSSEMRGIERLMAAINQSISDEELALALEGLGVYATDAGTPIDDEGNEVPWNIGPGRVVETPDGKKFQRVTGISTVTPQQDHLRYLHDRIDSVFGISSVAKGDVDVNVAESGIALYLELAPLLAHADEKDAALRDTFTQMLFDIPKWAVAYEGGTLRSLVDVTRYIPVFGDRIPVNREGRVKEILELLKAKAISASYARMKLRELGYDDMPDEATIAAELESAALTEQDAFGARVDAEVSGALAEGAAAGNGATE